MFISDCVTVYGFLYISQTIDAAFDEKALQVALTGQLDYRYQNQYIVLIIGNSSRFFVAVSYRCRWLSMLSGRSKLGENLPHGAFDYFILARYSGTGYRRTERGRNRQRAKIELPRRLPS